MLEGRLWVRQIAIGIRASSVCLTPQDLERLELVVRYHEKCLVHLESQEMQTKHRSKVAIDDSGLDSFVNHGAHTTMQGRE